MSVHDDRLLRHQIFGPLSASILPMEVEDTLLWIEEEADVASTHVAANTLNRIRDRARATLRLINIERPSNSGDVK